ncbi:MAG: twin transmembrane helix small protein [Caulobacteraceae bacterium]
MRTIFDILVILAVAAVAITLGLGVYAMRQQGEEWRARSNKLMRLRVILQFAAVLILIAAFWWKFGSGH